MSLAALDPAPAPWSDRPETARQFNRSHHADKVLVITSDGRCHVGVLKACDQTTNIVLAETKERIFSSEVLSRLTPRASGDSGLTFRACASRLVLTWHCRSRESVRSCQIGAVDQPPVLVL